MAASGAYDVLALVHDFPFRSLPSEVATANEVARQLLAATRDRPGVLPVYVSLTSGEPPPETKAVLDAEGGGAPLLRGALESFRAIAELARWERRHATRPTRGPWRVGWPALADDRTTYGAEPGSVSPAGVAAPASPRKPVALSERESLALLAKEGLPVTRAIPVTDAAAAVASARALGGHVALKLDADGLEHKSDIGGVALGLHGDDEVYRAALALLELGRRRALAVHGLLVEPMAAPGVELILGMRRDPQFGPVVLVGLGGILAEVLDDVAIRLAPLDLTAATAMLDSLRGSAVLRGVRGRPAVDRGALAAMLVTLGRIGVDRPYVLEIDLNPVIATPGGAVAVDALVVMEQRDGRP
jgi:acyl-CoA synthetase (NDP forming)